MILFKTAVKQEVTAVKGKEPEGDISPLHFSHYSPVLPVYGLYADCENTGKMFCREENGAGDD